MAEEAANAAPATPTPAPAVPAAPAAVPAAGGAAPAPANGAAKPAGQPKPGEGNVTGKVDDAAKGYWPNDWRQNIAGEDKALLKQLERFGSPKAIYDALRATKQKMDSGELKTGRLPKDATPEQVQAYRKEHDVPEKFEGYYDKMALPDGLVVGEEDKPIVNEVLKAAHEVHAPQPVINRMVAAYYKAREAEQAAQDDADLEHKASNEDLLRGEWGPEYRQNVNIVSNFLRQTFGDATDRLLTARLADGKVLGSDAEMLRPILALAREMNPVATVVGHAGAATLDGIQNRIATLQTMMGDRESAYYKGPQSEKLQKEYRDLINARERMGAKAA